MEIQLFDWVENIVGKGEIARFEQFLLFPQCFQKLSVVDVSKWVSMEYRVNLPVFSKSLIHPKPLFFNYLFYDRKF